MLGVLVIALLGQQLGPCGVDGPIYCTGAPLAFFEFAPTSGAGMGTACACTTPTGAQGETLTFTRASSATCLKSGTLTGIANGDMVTCSSNQPRVMPGGDGTGGNGLLVEGPRTNDVLRSQEFDNAAWVKANSVVAAPIVTADQAVAPDGTTTADRVQFAASTGAQYSVVDQAGATAAYTGSIFVKGNGTSGSIDLDCWNSSANVCTTCNFVAGSWVRCSCSNTLLGATLFIVGNYSAGCGTGARSAQDVFLWGGQFEQGPYATSYIATAGATVTRLGEGATFPLSLSNATGSMALTVVPDSSGLPDLVEHGLLALSTAGPNYAHLLDWRPSATVMTFYSLAGGGVNAPGVIGANTRVAGFWTSASSVSSCVAGTCNTGSWGGVTPTTLVEIGTYSGAQHANGVIKQACIDPNPARCR
jgi:hypothetical protein